MYCGLILAGGDSSRMGDDKAKMNFGGRSLAAIAAENLHVRTSSFLRGMVFLGKIGITVLSQMPRVGLGHKQGYSLPYRWPMKWVVNGCNFRPVIYHCSNPPCSLFFMAKFPQAILLSCPMVPMVLSPSWHWLDQRKCALRYWQPKI